MIPAQVGLAKRLLVCGDRHWVDRALIDRTLVAVERTYGPIELIIHGAADGADTMAGESALALGWDVHSYPADWVRFGKPAGPIRNTQMLAEGKPTMCIAFHANIWMSKGTANMVSQAQRAGVPGFVVNGRGRHTVWMVDGKLEF